MSFKLQFFYVLIKEVILPVNFPLVHEMLDRDNFTLPAFEFLKEDGLLAEVQLFQPEGDIEADVSGVRSRNRREMMSKLVNFLQLPTSDLVVAPEYCCPWELIDQLGIVAPRTNSLWVMGFESITPEELITVRDSNPNIKWYLDLPEIAGRTFFSPLLYIFKANHHEDGEKLIIVVQFKTHPMSDVSLQLERHHLIVGNNIYIFKLPNFEIRLASIICADSLVLKPHSEFPQWGYLPYILIHPQLNEDPVYDQFRSYRSDWASVNGGDKKQILCLNWARGTKINTQERHLTKFGKSCFYTKDHISFGANDLQENYDRGLYYTYAQNRTHGFYANFDEHVFKLRIAKVSRVGTTEAVANISCPKVTSVYSWDGTSWGNGTNLNADYGRVCFWDNGNFQILQSTSPSALDKEIIINKGIGEFLGKGRKDFQLLNTFLVTGDERIKRLTFIQDGTPDAPRLRNGINTIFQEFCSVVLVNINNYPMGIKHFYNNSTMGIFGKVFNLENHDEIEDESNLPMDEEEEEDEGRKDRAYICYLGNTDELNAKKFYKEVTLLVHPTEKTRVCVWYRNVEGTLNSIADASKKITEPRSMGMFDITRGD